MQRGSCFCNCENRGEYIVSYGNNKVWCCASAMHLLSCKASVLLLSGEFTKDNVNASLYKAKVRKA